MIGEVLAGLVLGPIVAWLPVVQFSGESQMAVLIADYAKYAPIAMIGIAFLKVLMTNMCIQMGLKGGHFFPLIFSAVCLGYGISHGRSPRNLCSCNHHSRYFKRVDEKTSGSYMSFVFMFPGSDGRVDFSGSGTCRSGNKEEKT